MRLNLRALAAFLRDVCAACRPADDLMAIADATAEPPVPAVDWAAVTPQPDELPEPLYHAVVSEMAEALAAARAASVGDADWAAWSRELMFEGES